VDGNIETWVPSAFQGHLSIDVGNRYFTPLQHALQDRQISFSPTIDPDNILSEAMGEEFVHTEDNEVEYYEAGKEAGRTKHYDINPNAIRVGDILEVQISFEGIRLKGNRTKMAIILRAITVLDKRAHDNAIKARAEARANEIQRPVILKRKIGYHDEKDEDEEDMPDAARMKVDERT